MLLTTVTAYENVTVTGVMVGKGVTIVAVMVAVGEDGEGDGDIGLFLPQAGRRRNPMQVNNMEKSKFLFMRLLLLLEALVVGCYLFV